MEKHQSKANKWAAKQGSYFSMIFKFYTQGLLLSKSSQKFLFSKITTFWKKDYGFHASPLPLFFNLNLLSHFDEILYEKSFHECYLKNIIRNVSGNFNFKIFFGKNTLTYKYLSFDSYNPIEHKESVVWSLLHRKNVIYSMWSGTSR